MLFFFSWGTGISQALMIRYLISSQFYLTFSLISTYKTRIRSKEYEENIEIFLPQTQDKQRHKEKLPCPSKWALSYQPGSHSLFVLGIPWDCLNSHSTFLMLWSPLFYVHLCIYVHSMCFACMYVCVGFPGRAISALNFSSPAATFNTVPHVAVTPSHKVVFVVTSWLWLCYCYEL